MSTKPLSRSGQLIAATHRAALEQLAAAPEGQMLRRDMIQAVEQSVPMEDWARETLQVSGDIRWRSLFDFASVGMVKAGWIVKDRKTWRITQEGRDLLSRGLDPHAYLKELDQKYNAWKASQIASAAVASAATPDIDEDELVPTLELPTEVVVEATLKAAHEALAAELIDTIKTCDPDFFERLVVRLLRSMGYGGSRHDAGRVVGKSGDGGIDGVIDEDRLGLDSIYLQAKRWAGAVGEPEVRDFKGALDAKGAHEGVLITTSHFTPAAVQAASNSRHYRIVLIDGARLADLMIEHNLGVQVAATYTLKRVDTDFFADE